jgi:hypothetical protein
MLCINAALIVMVDYHAVHEIHADFSRTLSMLIIFVVLWLCYGVIRNIWRVLIAAIQHCSLCGLIVSLQTHDI